ncbi:MAG: glycosyltransferase family protein [Acidiferrobacteraceae bacterium]
MLGAPRLFIAFGPDWGRHPSSLGHLMRAVARTEPVVWINSIAQRSPRFTLQDTRRAAQKLWAGLRARADAAGDGIVVVHPRVLPYHQYAIVRKLNGRLLGRQLKPLLAHPRPQSLVVVSSNPAAIALIEHLKPDLSCYFCMDDYARMSDSDARLIEICEELMLRRADRVFATSQTLCALKNGGRFPAIHLPHGVDADHFGVPPPPPDVIARLPRPIIGFHGIIGSRVDIELIERIAVSFPKASIVTLGKVEVNLSLLRRHSNFHVFDAVPYEDLPRWIQAFDIGLVAYRHDGHTQSVNPLKLLEYLALGIPVVADDVPELKFHGTHIITAKSHDSYLAAVAGLIARYPFSDGERAERRAYARMHTWEQRAERFLAVCDGLSEGRYERDGMMASQRTSHA